MKCFSFMISSEHFHFIYCARSMIAMRGKGGKRNVRDIGYFVHGKMHRHWPAAAAVAVAAVHTIHRIIQYMHIYSLAYLLERTHTFYCCCGCGCRCRLLICSTIPFLSLHLVFSFVAIPRNGAQFIFNIYIVNFKIAKWYSILLLLAHGSSQLLPSSANGPISRCRIHFVACLFMLLRRFIDR